MENKNYEVFLEADVSGFIGEWIAICDGQVISHGKKVKEVYNEATKKCPGKRPFIARIPENESMIF